MDGSIPMKYSPLICICIYLYIYIFENIIIVIFFFFSCSKFSNLLCIHQWWSFIRWRQKRNVFSNKDGRWSC